MTSLKEFMNCGPVTAYASNHRAASMAKEVFPDIEVNLPKTTLRPTLNKKKAPANVRTTSRS